MPLHLLGKKSWNVYNADNIARVRRDEAAAEAQEAADEQRMQEEDAARRLAILRGEQPPTLEPIPVREPRGGGATEKTGSGHRSERRPRKRAGEDETDFEMRLASERAAQGAKVSADAVSNTLVRQTHVPIVDRAGHISLFGEDAERDAKHSEKNEEAEREAAKKRREFEDQYQMRLVNAAGRDGAGLTDGGPWYAKQSSGTAAEVHAEAPSLDAFGRQDPSRKSRDASRLALSDPLAAMKQGAAKVRALGEERKRERDERDKELEALRRDEKRRSRYRHSERSRSPGRRKSDNYRSRDEDARRRSHESHDRKYGKHGEEHRHHRSREERHRRHDRKRRDEDT